MNRRSMLACMVLVAIAAAPATQKSPTSSDGVPYGYPVPLKMDVPWTPVAGSMLGKPPKQSLGIRQVWSREKSPEKVDALFKYFKSTPKITSTFYTKGGYANDTVTGFDVEDGRIVRVVTYFPGEPDRRVSPLMDQLQAVTKSGHIMASGGRLVGNLVDIQVNAVEWYLAHHRVSGEISAAMRGQELVAGMTQREAFAAMQRFQRHNVSQTESSVTIEWYLWSAEDGREVPYWGATISDGKVIAVHDLR